MAAEPSDSFSETRVDSNERSATLFEAMQLNVDCDWLMDPV